jgi:hypothetical protein
MLYYAFPSGGNFRTSWPKNLQSVGAVVAGAAVSIILEVGTDSAMRAAGIFPKAEGPMSDALFVLATSYRTIYGVLGA